MSIMLLKHRCFSYNSSSLTSSSKDIKVVHSMVTVVSHCGPRTGSVNYKGQDINTLFLRNAFAEMPLVWRSAGFESVGTYLQVYVSNLSFNFFDYIGHK